MSASFKQITGLLDKILKRRLHFIAGVAHKGAFTAISCKS
jgi:hypothetical protein